MIVFHEQLSWKFRLTSWDQRRPRSCLCPPPEVGTWLLSAVIVFWPPSLSVLFVSVRVARSILLSCQCNSSRTTAEPVTGSVSEPGTGLLVSLQSWKTDHVWHPRDDYPVKIRKEAFFKIHSVVPPRFCASHLKTRVIWVLGLSPTVEQEPACFCYFLSSFETQHHFFFWSSFQI